MWSSLPSSWRVCSPGSHTTRDSRITSRSSHIRLWQPGQKASELIRKALAIGLIEGRRAAGLHAAAALFLQEIAQRQALADVVRLAA